MKCSVLFLALLFSACASDSQSGSAIGRAGGDPSEHRKSGAEAKPAAPQQPVSIEGQPAANQPQAPVEAQPAMHQAPAPVEAQQPARSDQTEPPAKKSEHNIEED